MNEQQKDLLRQVIILRINELYAIVNSLSLESSQDAVRVEIDELGEILKYVTLNHI